MNIIVKLNSYSTLYTALKKSKTNQIYVKPSYMELDEIDEIIDEDEVSDNFSFHISLYSNILK